MPSRKLTDLHPEVQAKARALVAKCRAAGIDLLVTCTWRSDEEQAALYAQGRTKPGRIVTNAQPGQSKHNGKQGEARALDVVPLVNGKPVWGTDGEDGVLWERVGVIGESCGLQWAGRWKRMREFPHFEA